MFDALLHTKWEVDERGACGIIGYWAEDGNSYEITVPHQLRDQLVEMQNWLSDKYATYEKAKRTVRDIENFFEK